MGQPNIEDDITYRSRQIIEGGMFEDFVYMQLEEKLKVSIEGCNTREEQFSRQKGKLLRRMSRINLSFLPISIVLCMLIHLGTTAIVGLMTTDTLKDTIQP